MRIDKVKWFHLLLIFLSALLNAALSENGAAFQAAALGLLLIYFIWHHFKFKHKDGTHLILTAIALAGTAAGIVVMWLSPSITEQLSGVDHSVMNALKLSVTHTFDNYLGYFKTHYLVVAVLLLTGGLFAIVLRIVFNNDKNPGSKSGLKNILIILLIQAASLVLVFSLMLPSAYTRSAFPDPRHLIGAALVMTANALITGFCLVEAFSNLFKQQAHRFRLILGFGSAIALILIGVLYPIRYIPQITRERLLFKYWSQQWEKRNGEIVTAAGVGEKSHSCDSPGPHH